MTASLCFQDSISIASIVGSPDIFIVCDICPETDWPAASGECLFLTPTNFVPAARPAGTVTKKQPILIHDLELLSFLRFRLSLSLDMKTLIESPHMLWIHFGSFFCIFLILLFGIGFLAAM